MKYVDENCCAFRIDVEDNKFGVWVDDLDYFKTISIQEYRERFGNSDISKTETTEIDWSKPGQLLKYEEEDGKKWFLLTNGNHNGSYFEATVISKSYWALGSFHINFVKSAFKICTEPITLKNE